MDVSRETNVYRKWFGVLFLLVEMNLLGGTIFGFASIFEVLSKLKIYQNGCESSSSTTTNSCSQQTKQYQVSLKKWFEKKILFSFISKNAITLGIAFFDLPAFFIGILIDKFGCRSVKLISM